MLLKFSSTYKGLKLDTQKLTPRELVKMHMKDQQHRVTEEDLKQLKVGHPELKEAEGQYNKKVKV